MFPATVTSGGKWLNRDEGSIEPKIELGRCPGLDRRPKGPKDEK